MFLKIDDCDSKTSQYDKLCSGVDTVQYLALEFTTAEWLGQEVATLEKQTSEVATKEQGSDIAFKNYLTPEMPINGQPALEVATVEQLS